MKWLKRLFGQKKSKVWVKYQRSTPIKEVSATTAYQRGIQKGKQLELKRILSVLESQKENPTLGEPLTIDILIGYINFFLNE